MTRLPFWPTLVVALAAAVMLSLGVWQLGRAGEKDALIARLSANPRLPPVGFPAIPTTDSPLLFRRATGYCLEPVAVRAVAGRDAAGEAGWSHIPLCRTGAEGPGMAVDIGWSKTPGAPRWAGGEVHGLLVPDRDKLLRLVAATPAPGLRPSAPPTPDSLPNNHRFYALQWFFFAAAAVVIYLLALRRRGVTPEPHA